MTEVERLRIELATLRRLATRAAQHAEDFDETTLTLDERKDRRRCAATPGQCKALAALIGFLDGTVVAPLAVRLYVGTYDEGDGAMYRGCYASPGEALDDRCDDVEACTVTLDPAGGVTVTP